MKRITLFLICPDCNRHSAVKVKTEVKSPASKPVQSALNSTVEEKPKYVKHDKVKSGKPVKAEKKGDKKMDGVKKEKKKEKKTEGAKAMKKHVDSEDDDDDEPLVRLNFKVFFLEL